MKIAFRIPFEISTRRKIVATGFVYVTSRSACLAKVQAEQILRNMLAHNQNYFTWEAQVC